jgi:hypothetical protein
VCDICGDGDFGNKGAASSHENACGGGDSGGQQGGQTVEMVVEDDPQQGGQRGGAPATQEQMGVDDAGRAVGEGIRAVQDTDRDPQERAQGLVAAGGTLINLVGGLFEQVAEGENEEERAERQRAKQADLEPEDGPTCATEGCSHQFSRVPVNKDTVRCPQCGMSYRIRDKGSAR